MLPNQTGNSFKLDRKHLTRTHNIIMENFPGHNLTILEVLTEERI